MCRTTAGEPRVNARADGSEEGGKASAEDWGGEGLEGFGGLGFRVCWFRVELGLHKGVYGVLQSRIGSLWFIGFRAYWVLAEDFKLP